MRRVRWSVIPAVLLVAGCAGRTRSPKLIWVGEDGNRAADARTASAGLPAASPGVRMGPWGNAQDASYLLLATETGEVPHVHDQHDLTVVLLEGSGWLGAGGERWDLVAGDVVHVRRGMMHHFHPALGRPVVGLAIYAPKLEGRDFRIIELK